MAAPAGNAWTLTRNANHVVATYIGQPPADVNWDARFRAPGDANWLDAGGNVLDTPFVQVFDPWPQNGIEAQVRYTDEQGQPLSDWSLSKSLA